MDAQSPNVHDQQPFEYSPLHVKDGIRLVTVCPASFHEPIACTLVYTELDSNPEYEALSYTWGNHQNLVSIKVNDRCFGITHNLATALRYLRKEWEVTLWIDAICINQNDVSERTQQVKLMTDIYQRARRVQIWLGPAADDSEVVMEFFRKFAEKPMKLVRKSLSEADSLSALIVGRTRAFLEYLVSWPAGELDVPDEPLPTDEPTEDEIYWLRGYLIDEKRLHLCLALEALLAREYWYRAWVVQEILMASSISLNCGSSSVPWECVTTVVKAHMDNESRTLFDLWLEHRPRYFSQTRYMRLASFETIGHLASVRLDVHASRGPKWLLEMLLKLRHFKSKDPRDKIFSLLGLIDKQLFQSSPSDRHILSVDYNLEFSEVSIRLFIYYVLAHFHCSIVEDEIPQPRASRPGEVAQDLHRGSLNILCASQPTNRSEGLPSWVPDFSRDNGMECWPCYENYQYRGLVDHGPSIYVEDTLLEVSGVVVTTLEQGYVTHKDDDTEATDDHCLLTRIRKFMLLAESKDPSALATNAFWSALQLGKNTGRMIRGSLDMHMEAYPGRPDQAVSSLLFQALESRVGDSTRVAVSFLDNFRRGSLHRRFAMMRIGRELRPAMVPADARPGDILHLLRDFDYPALLRSVDDRSCNFEFVGPCCIPEWCADKDSSHYGPIKKIMLQ